MSVSTPYYENGDISFHATAAVTGKRFLAISGNRTGGPGLSTDAENLYRAAHAGVNGNVIGVAKYDVASGEVGGMHGHPGQIVPVTAGEDLAAGQLVTSDGSGKAVAATTRDSLATGAVGSNNAITWTSRGDDDITVTLVDPGGATASLSVDVDGHDIVVSLARAASALSSTAAQVMAAIVEHDGASGLVTTASTGASNGTGIVAAVAQTPLAGSTLGGRAAGLAMSAASADTDAQIKLF